ncbi:unnamed protein product (macronuclear) [Paramecium tetraurelia]|uniref:Uncharacterized protein n=1 Tax=Paramecium tetraurelia TaxID=5888 RepID=A0CIJ1_PARTE|nr:uncharacterized protein GSPATT00007743001 [Paramecium tetraurelia]CAK70608.1 unnamed protein product [Paramecium tetraurelia]|eukprot:XP_001438005.1 hypothetical protein (macronuclear) [Paramecium tetraurelia strain d4-2]
MSAVPNYQQSSKVIVLGQYQSGRGFKEEGRLRMDAKESIFERIQINSSEAFSRVQFISINKNNIQMDNLFQMEDC